MARLNVPPTKSNQLALRRDLAMASEGYDLLEQKRQILVLELMRLLHQVKSVQQRLQQRQARAYDTLRKAVARNGYHRMRNIASGIHYEHNVKSDYRLVAGVRVPTMTISHGEFTLQFGFAGTDSLSDQTMQDFLQLTETVSEMAELESSIWLLARELKKTQRRVNALEQIFIPDFTDTLRYISESLESKDLESFSYMKMIKKKLAKRE